MCPNVEDQISYSFSSFLMLGQDITLFDYLVLGPKIREKAPLTFCYLKDVESKNCFGQTLQMWLEVSMNC